MILNTDAREILEQIAKESMRNQFHAGIPAAD